ncbi:MAG: (Fe-S)-binding protein, partial [Ignavibacteria bacterium]|nr:(Fe-S)-binding protein [Ignavibacteria bacterium]
ILSLVVIESFIEGFIPYFSFHFIGKIYSVITLSQDIFGALVFFVVIFSLLRRYIGTPKRLQVEKSSRMDAAFILVLIMLVIATMFGTNIERILLGHSHGFRPVSAFLARILAGSGSDFAYSFFWWAHNLVVLGFLNYLPYSKHFHVLSSVPNTFLSNFKIEKKNVLKPVNFEDESIEQYGAKDIEDLTWKQLLDGYTCTECGRCTEVCPANNTGKLLNPKKIITQIRRRTMDKGPLVTGKTQQHPVLEKCLVHNYISQEELWACTTCAACVEECPVMIDHVTSIVDMRRNLTMMESSFPQELNTVFRNLENNESPWAFGPDSRNEWIEEFTEELLKESKEVNMKRMSNEGSADNVDVLFWVGCAGAFDKRYRNVTKSFAKIMNAAGVKFGVLGNEEKCNGDTARRLGNEFLAQQFIQQNIETFRKYNIKKIVTACPHCLHSLKNEYTKFGIELDVKHHSEFINRLISDGKIKPARKTENKFTYHDSCYLGRYNDIYSQPRNLINSVPGSDITEMRRTGDKGFCCGAGGGRMFMEENEGKRVNIERTEEAISTGADTIASACPFCMTMLTDGIKAKEKTDSVKVKDVAEIIAESL